MGEGSIAEPIAAEMSSVLDVVYQAALDPSQWPKAIEKAGAFLRCGAGLIATLDQLHLDGDILYSWGYEATFIATLVQSWKSAKDSKLLRYSFRRGICEIVSTAEARHDPKLHQYEPYQEWAQPQSIIDAMQTMLERTATTVVLAAFSRFAKEGRLDDETLGRFGLLAPHLRRAFLIAKTIDNTRLRAETLAQTIDGLAAGVFLVDDDMHLIHVNASGKIMLASDFLQLSNGFLRAAEARANRLLAESVGAASRGDMLLSPAKTTIVLTARSGERFNAQVLRLDAGLLPGAVARHATVAIFIRKATMDFPAPLQAVVDLHGLTAAESRVLTLIVEINAVAGVATMLGLSQATVKSHLRSIFRKTSVSSQAELVKLVAGHASPLK